VDFMVYACSRYYVVKGKRLRIMGNPGPQLATGIDWTTILNSVSNIMYQVECQESSKTPEEIAYECGFEVKTSYYDDLGEGTFLKGWWKPTVNGEMSWLPLPSQVLKIGKVQREPRLFSANKRDAREGVDMLSHAIASSFQTIPRDYPILGPYIATLEKLGVKNQSVLSASEDGWYKPQTTAVSVDWQVCADYMCSRYSVTINDIIRVEKLIRSVRKLPALLIDPVFIALARDYGVEL